MYLNDVKEGGHTSFPLASKECKDDKGYFGVKPTKGSVAWFYNLEKDGNVDPNTQHYAEPVCILLSFHVFFNHFVNSCM